MYSNPTYTFAFGPEKQTSAGPVSGCSILDWALWYMSKGFPEILRL